MFFSGGTAGLFFAGTSIGLTVSQIALAVSSIALSIGFAPDIPNIGAEHLAENLYISSSPIAVRGVPLGRTAIAGQVLFRKNIRDTDELLLILALAGYPSTALEKFWFNGESVFDGESTTGPGAITSGKFANELWVWFRTSEETTDAFPEIAALSTEWAAKQRKLRGIPAIAIRLKVTEKVEGRLEPLAQFKGAKLYDPRLDSTVPGGSGTHDFDDPTTWEWSKNPKLAELLYLRGGYVNGVQIFGMAKPKAGIDLENFAIEASICEEQIPVVAGGTIDRYSCNGLLIPSQDHRQNLRALLSASAGTMDASGGVYRTFAGAWRAPSMTLTEADIDGAPTELHLQKSPDEEINVVAGMFADPNDRWRVKEYPEFRDDASIALIGENAITLDLPFTVDHRMAQRIVKITTRLANAARAFAANYWLRMLALQPGDIVTQTYSRYSIDAETFRVNFWGLAAADDAEGNRRMVVPMQLTQELEEWFDWDEATEEKPTPSVTPLPPTDNNPDAIGEVNVRDANVHNVRSGVTVTSGVRFNANGQLEFARPNGSWNSSRALPGEWLGTGGRDYWVRFTVNSGTLDTGTEDTWLPTTSSEAFTIEQASAGTNSANVTAEIAADDAGAEILASAAYDLKATWPSDINFQNVVMPESITTVAVSFPNCSMRLNGGTTAAGAFAGQITSQYRVGGTIFTENDVHPGAWWAGVDPPTEQLTIECTGAGADGSTEDIDVIFRDEGGDPGVGAIRAISTTSNAGTWVARRLTAEGVGTTTITASFKVTQTVGGALVATFNATFICTRDP